MIDLQYAKKAFENYLNDYDRGHKKTHPIQYRLLEVLQTTWIS